MTLFAIPFVAATCPVARPAVRRSVFRRVGVWLFTVVLSLSVTGLALAQSFFPRGSMEVTRSQHTATLLDNGTVLVTGGFSGFSAQTGGPIATAEIYNPATGIWRYTLHPMNYARYGHTAVKLNNGKVLIAGGNPMPPAGEVLIPPRSNSR